MKNLLIVTFVLMNTTVFSEEEKKQAGFSPKERRALSDAVKEKDLEAIRNLSKEEREFINAVDEGDFETMRTLLGLRSTNQDRFLNAAETGDNVYRNSINGRCWYWA